MKFKTNIDEVKHRKSLANSATNLVNRLQGSDLINRDASEHVVKAQIILRQWHACSAADVVREIASTIPENVTLYPTGGLILPLSPTYLRDVTLTLELLQQLKELI